MFNLSIALRIVSAFIPLRMTPADFKVESTKSRGKSGKVSCKRSNAAVFKRAAKKRSNIRKHK